MCLAVTISQLLFLLVKLRLREAADSRSARSSFVVWPRGSRGPPPERRFLALCYENTQPLFRLHTPNLWALAGLFMFWKLCSQPEKPLKKHKISAPERLLQYSSIASSPHWRWEPVWHEQILFLSHKKPTWKRQDAEDSKHTTFTTQQTHHIKHSFLCLLFVWLDVY